MISFDEALKTVKSRTGGSTEPSASATSNNNTTKLNSFENALAVVKANKQAQPVQPTTDTTASTNALLGIDTSRGDSASALSMNTQNADKVTSGAKKYSDILSRSDYAEKSKVDTSIREGNGLLGKLLGNSDNTYDYINNNNGFADRVNGGAAKGNDDLQKYQFMTDNDKGIYNYLYNTSGRKSAEEYLSSIDKELTKDEYNRKMKAVQDFTKESTLNKAFMTGANLVTTLPRDILSTGQATIDAVRAFTGGEVNEYSNANLLNESFETAKSATTEGMSVPGRMAYNAVVSGVENLERWAFAAGIGNIRGWDADKMAKLVPEITSAMMSSSVMIDAVKSGKEKGYSDIGAVTLGIIRGGVEYLTEKIGGDKVAERFLKNATDSSVKKLLETAIAEAAEEVYGGVANEFISQISDYLFQTAESDYLNNKNEYMKQGMTESQAIAKSLEDFGLGILESAGTAALSAGGTAVGGKIASGASAIRQIAKENENAKQNITESANQFDAELNAREAENNDAKAAVSNETIISLLDDEKTRTKLQQLFGLKLDGTTEENIAEVRTAIENASTPAQNVNFQETGFDVNEKDVESLKGFANLVDGNYVAEIRDESKSVEENKQFNELVRKGYLTVERNEDGSIKKNEDGKCVYNITKRGVSVLNYGNENTQAKAKSEAYAENIPVKKKSKVQELIEKYEYKKITLAETAYYIESIAESLNNGSVTEGEYQGYNWRIVPQDSGETVSVYIDGKGLSTDRIHFFSNKLTPDIASALKYDLDYVTGVGSDLAAMQERAKKAAEKASQKEEADEETEASQTEETEAEDNGEEKKSEVPKEVSKIITTEYSAESNARISEEQQRANDRAESSIGLLTELSRIIDDNSLSNYHASEILRDPDLLHRFHKAHPDVNLEGMSMRQMEKAIGNAIREQSAAEQKALESLLQAVAVSNQNTAENASAQAKQYAQDIDNGVKEKTTTKAEAKDRFEFKGKIQDSTTEAMASARELHEAQNKISELEKTIKQMAKEQIAEQRQALKDTKAADRAWNAYYKERVRALNDEWLTTAKVASEAGLYSDEYLAAKQVYEISKQILDLENKLRESESKSLEKTLDSKERERASKTREQWKSELKRLRKELSQARHAKSYAIGHAKLVSNSLYKLLLSETDKHHIPQDMKQMVIDTIEPFVNAVKHNEDGSVMLDDDGNPVADHSVFDKKKIEKLKKALPSIEDYLNRHSEDGGAFEQEMATDENVIADLHSMFEAFDTMTGNKSLSEMSLKQLDFVNNYLDYVDNAVKQANEEFKKSKYNARLGDYLRLLDDMDEATGRKKTTKLSTSDKAEKIRSIANQSTTAPFFFKHIGGVLQEKYQQMFDASRQYARNMSEAKQALEKIRNDNNFDKSWYSKGNDIEFKLSSGEVITLSKGAAMQIYATAVREKSLNDDGIMVNHLKGGGIVLDSKQQKDKNGNWIRTSKAFTLTHNDINNIMSTLTADQKAYVDAIQDYVSSDIADIGNAASRKLCNIDKFTESKYIPFVGSENFLFYNTNITSDTKLTNQSHTRRLSPNASSPVVISDFDSVMSAHIHNMNMYATVGVAQDDFVKLYNFRSTESNGNFDEKGRPVMVKHTAAQQISDSYGEAVNKYIKQFLADINGGVSQKNNFADSLLGRFKKMAVLGNISVVLQQPSAIMRASYLMDYKYIMQGISQKSNYDEMAKYADTAILKEMGGFDTGTSYGPASYLIDNDYSLKHKMDELMSMGAEKADLVTWSKLWNAVKLEIQAKENLDGEALLKRAGERFDEIVNYTQVYDNVMAKNEWMRSKDGVMKMFTAFKNEPSITANVAQDALWTAKREFDDTGKLGEKGTKAMKAATGAILGQAVVNSLLKSIVSAMRDKDEDETFAEKYVEHFFDNVKDETNPLGWYPFLSDIKSKLDGYDFSNPYLSTLNDFMDSWDKLKGYYSDWKDGEFLADPDSKFKDIDNLMYNALTEFSIISGIPVKNLYKDISALVRTAAAGFKEDAPKNSADGIKDAALIGLGLQEKKTTSQKNAASYNKLMQAIEDGDRELYEKLYKSLLEDGKDYSTIEAGIKAEYKKTDAYKSSLESATEALTESYESNEEFKNLDFLTQAMLHEKAEKLAQEEALNQFGFDTDSKSVSEITDAGVDPYTYLMVKNNQNTNGSSMYKTVEYITGLGMSEVETDATISYFLTTEAALEKFETIRAAGISSDVYADMLTALGGTVSQKSLYAWLASRKDLTDAQREIIWKAMGSSWKKSYTQYKNSKK